MPNNVTAKAKDKQKTLKVNRPSWEKVYEGYPKIERDGMVDDLDAKSVFISIFSERSLPHFIDPQTGSVQNACATRLSLGLLNAQVSLQAAYRLDKGEFSGKGIITSAIRMIEFLTKTFGKADEIIENPNSFEVVKKRIGTRTGIYAMVPKQGAFRSASGHVTLWTGDNVIGHHHYAELAKTIYFWEFK